MSRHSLYARAKINLTLDVTGRRPDGYHTVRMILQTVDLADHLVVETDTGRPGVTVRTNLYYLPADGRNLAHQAAELFLEHTGVENRGITIHIGTKIPVAAGLAGGSTDAAAVLLALNHLYRTRLTRQELMDLGVRLGADVPYCLLGGTALAEGIGEELTPLPAMPALPVVLCKPPFSVSTRKVYQRLSEIKLTHHPDTAGMMEALKQGSTQDICQRLYNVMEEVTAARHRQIGQIKSTLFQFGATGAVMSGSGPTVYGVFTEPERARACYRHLRREYRDTFLTRISPRQAGL